LYYPKDLLTSLHIQNLISKQIKHSGAVLSKIFSIFSQMTDVLSSYNQWSRNNMSGVSPKQQHHYQKHTRRTIPRFTNDLSPRVSPRKITLYRNGDRYSTGKQISLVPQNYMNLRHLLQELSNTMDLPYGVRRLFTPNHGSEITDIHVLKDGASYVCASFEPFQKLEYTAINAPHVTFTIEPRKCTLTSFFY
jgi:hypothetical protein